VSIAQKEVFHPLAIRRVKAWGGSIRWMLLLTWLQPYAHAGNDIGGKRFRGDAVTAARIDKEPSNFSDGVTLWTSQSRVLRGSIPGYYAALTPGSRSPNQNAVSAHPFS